MRQDLGLRPNWSAPPQVQALTTYRFNDHIKGKKVIENIQSYKQQFSMYCKNNFESFGLPHPPSFLNQIHGGTCVISEIAEDGTKADAMATQLPQILCSILTADCLPILLTDKYGTEIAAIHAGWRSLASGIIKNTLDTMSAKAHDLLAWFGPAISMAHFQVREDFVAYFTPHLGNPRCFKRESKETWLASLIGIATTELENYGVTQYYYSERCTYSEPDFFYSYRRNKKCGSMATFIWLKP